MTKSAAETLPAVQSDAASLMDVITRAAKDPSVDVNKLERLMAMYERINGERAKREFDAGMNACQAELRPISQDAANPQTRSKYASYAALDNAIRPIYTKHGFAVSFNTDDGAPDGYVRNLAEVTHRGGHSKFFKLDIPCDGLGAKGGAVMTKTHATMSAVSYGRRGLSKMIWNLAEGEYDDDGNAAGAAPGLLTADQVAWIIQVHDENHFPLPKFLAWAGVERVEDIPADKWPRVQTALKAKIEQANAKGAAK